MKVFYCSLILLFVSTRETFSANISSKMKIALCCFLFVNTPAMGYYFRFPASSVVKFELMEYRMYSNNVNSTQTDFGVYFYYDDGGEEPLVDCAWTKSHLHCIKQKGFHYKLPVSDTAEITIPTSFRHKNGSYRCVSDGNRHTSIKSCRLPDMRDQDFFSTCEAKAGSNYQVTVKCTFSLNVKRFKVIKSEVVVANYTRSSCHNSTFCEHNLKDNNEIFIVKFVVTELPYDDYYYCLPSHPALSDNITGCSLSNDANNERVTAPVYLATLAFVPAGIVAVIIIN